MKAGSLDRVITLQQRTSVPDALYGTPVETWNDVAEVYANVQDVLPSRGEGIADGINIARRPCRIRIRWRDDVTSAMRVRINDRVLRIITMPAELGRRAGLEFMAEELTTEGQEP